MAFKVGQWVNSKTGDQYLMGRVREVCTTPGTEGIYWVVFDGYGDQKNGTARHESELEPVDCCGRE
jgi:hypothetical protein